MIEYILKRISKREYDKHKHDPTYIIKSYYKKGHGLLYQINNPPDGFRYYKIVGNARTIIYPLHLSEEFIRVINEYRVQQIKAHRK